MLRRNWTRRRMRCEIRCLAPRSQIASATMRTKQQALWMIRGLHCSYSSDLMQCWRLAKCARSLPADQCRRLAQEEEREQLQAQTIEEELADGGDVDVASGRPTAAAATAAGDLAQSPAQLEQPAGQPHEGRPPRPESPAGVPKTAKGRADAEAGRRTPPNGSGCACLPSDGIALLPYEKASGNVIWQFVKATAARLSSHCCSRSHVFVFSDGEVGSSHRAHFAAKLACY